VCAENAPKNYFSVVSHPKDLSTVKGRLASLAYTQIYEFLSDMETIWTNCETFYGDPVNSPDVSPQDRRLFKLAAAEGRRLFAKERTIFERPTVAAWCEKVYNLRTAVTDLMTQPPGKVKQFAANIGTARTMKQAQPPVTERELRNFIIAGQLITSDEDHREMIKILTSAQGNAEPETTGHEWHVNVTTLAPATLQALKEYMKKALEKSGQKYPE
jgi:hypothetical protein